MKILYTCGLLILIGVFTGLKSQTPAPGISPSFSQGFTDLLTFPISTIDLIINRVSNSGLMPVFYGLMSPLYNTVGRVQCSSPSSMFGFPIFRFVFNPPEEARRQGRQLDFGGNYACPGTCTGGTCVPYTSMTIAPTSLSYFRCSCPASSCGPQGPVFQYPVLVQGTRIRCDPYEHCNCDGLGGSTGWMCNWMNIKINQTINLEYSVPAQLSPVRWCACCAKPTAPAPSVTLAPVTSAPAPAPLVQVTSAPATLVSVISAAVTSAPASGTAAVSGGSASANASASVTG